MDSGNYCQFWKKFLLNCLGVPMWSIFHLSIWLPWVVEQTGKAKGVAWANSTWGTRHWKENTIEIIFVLLIKMYKKFSNFEIEYSVWRQHVIFKCKIKETQSCVVLCVLCQLKLSNWWHGKNWTKSYNCCEARNIGFLLIDQWAHMCGKHIHIGVV